MEQSDLQMLQFAVVQQVLASFIYDGKLRVVEVHAAGSSTKDGKPIIRAYQVAGTSSSRTLPQWGLFSLDKMEQLTLIPTSVSQAPRDGFNPNDPVMTPVFFAAKG